MCPTIFFAALFPLTSQCLCGKVPRVCRTRPLSVPLDPLRDFFTPHSTAPNSFRFCTYQFLPSNPFRMNTYEKTWGGGTNSGQLPSRHHRSCIIALTPLFATHPKNPRLSLLFATHFQKKMPPIPRRPTSTNHKSRVTNQLRCCYPSAPSPSPIGTRFVHRLTAAVKLPTMRPLGSPVSVSYLEVPWLSAAATCSSKA